MWKDESNDERNCTDRGRARKAADVWEVDGARERAAHLCESVGMVDGYGSASCEGFCVADVFKCVSTDLCG